MKNIRGSGIGGAIEAIRVIRGITQEELSINARLNIQLIEQKMDGISTNDLERIASCLNVPFSFICLLADKGENPLITVFQEAVITSLTKASMDKQ